MKKRLASRGSALALWQARYVQKRLQESHPGLTVDIDVVTTTGDRIRGVPLARIGETGLFTREVDESVLDGRADFAVHSLKDVPTQPDAGLVLAAVPEREDPRDALIVAPGVAPDLTQFPAGARVGTSSLRRRALLLGARPDLEVADLRGNLDTRLARVKRAEFDAIILAAAGLRRMRWEAEIAQFMDPVAWPPAPGQGALGLVCREEDDEMHALLGALDDDTARAATTAERVLLRTLEGGCQIPIGAHATLEGERMHLHAFVASVSGADSVRAERSGPAHDPAALGRALAEDMIARGASVILDAVRAQGEDGVPRATAP